MHVRQFVGRRLKWGKKKNGLASDKAEILKVLHTVIRNVVKYGMLNHHWRHYERKGLIRTHQTVTSCKKRETNVVCEYSRDIIC
jgi:hypothetical protein